MIDFTDKDYGETLEILKNLSYFIRKRKIFLNEDSLFILYSSKERPILFDNIELEYNSMGIPSYFTITKGKVLKEKFISICSNKWKISQMN